VARGGARLSPGTFPGPPHALLPTHISLQRKSLDFVWLITYGHHCTTSSEQNTDIPVEGITTILNGPRTGSLRKRRLELNG